MEEREGGKGPGGEVGRKGGRGGEGGGGGGGGRPTGALIRPKPPRYPRRKRFTARFVLHLLICSSTPDLSSTYAERQTHSSCQGRAGTEKTPAKRCTSLCVWLSPSPPPSHPPSLPPSLSPSRPRPRHTAERNFHLRFRRAAPAQWTGRSSTMLGEGSAAGAPA